MNESINIKNNKSIKEDKENNNAESKKGYAFLDESEIIVNQIIEKIISLVISESVKNNIEKLLPDFCFDELKQTLEILTHLNYLTYDKDDLEIKKKIYSDKIKSAKYKKRENSLFIKENDDESYQNSEIIRKYKFEENYDPKILNDCSLDIGIFENSKNGDLGGEKEKEKEKDKEKNKDKIFLGILKRKEYKDKMTSFEKQEEEKRKLIEKGNKKFNYNFHDDKEKIYKQIYSNENDPFQINSDEKIEIIKNIENHKIDFLANSPINNNNNDKNNNIFIPFDTIVDSKNFWNQLSQPDTVPIDRDAGTKIKYEKSGRSQNKRKSTIIHKDKIILEEQKVSPKKKENLYSSKKKFNFSQNKENNNNKNKKKKIIQIEFESTDIDPKKLETYTETNEIGELRLKVEKEIQNKKIELEKIAQKERERIAKQEELEEIRKELSKKNVTVDIKGELVFIKPIDLKALNEEFNKGKSNFKIIKTIETEANYLKNKKNLAIEKNPEMNLWDSKEEKNKKKSKKKKEPLLLPKTGRASANSKKSEQKPIDKHEMRLAAGSNFTIINPEIGVNIIEDKKMKSGGKDFYKKYNRFSLEVFQDQLIKTATSNFFPTITDSSNQKNTISDKAKRRASIGLKQKILEEIEHNLNDIKQPNEDNNILSLKTKNLNIALQNLDLIKEGEENNITNNKKIINKNIIKNVMNKFGKTKSDYSEMNVFAKTLLESNNWGGADIYNDKKKDIFYKIPKKPEENELLRELPANLLKHMPRKRLPPIINDLKSNFLGQTSSGFFTNRKPKKIKGIIDESKKYVKTDRDN